MFIVFILGASLFMVGMFTSTPWAWQSGIGFLFVWVYVLTHIVKNALEGVKKFIDSNTH